MLHMSRLVSIFLLVFYIILYYFVPLRYDYLWNLLIFGLYVFSIFHFFISKRKSNYFDFDTIFLLGSFLVYFVYPVFLYPINPEYFSILAFDFNHTYITKSSSLALIGLQSYMVGSLFIKKVSCINNSSLYVISSKLNKCLFLLLYILLFFNLDRSFIKDDYSGGLVGTSSYILLLLISSIILLFLVDFNNFSKSKKINMNYRNNYLIYFLVMIFLIFFALKGVRTYVITVGMVVVGLYSLYIKRIPLNAFIVLTLIGMLSMSILGIFRSNRMINYSSIIDLGMDLIINSRNTYVAMEYVDNNGFTFGVSMLGPLLSFIPFAQSILLSLTNLSIYDISSSMFLTSQTLGEGFTLGLGTNIIADLFLSFGLLGVIIFMFGLGYYVNYLLSKDDFCSKLQYISLLSMSLYMIRGEYFSFMRVLIWTYVLYLMLYSINKRLSNENSIYKC